MISANLEVIWVMSVEAGQTGDARRIATPGRGNSVMKVLLISTYDLGHQPFGLASPTAWLREAGADVHCLDLAVEEFDEDAVAGAALVAIYLPMHTATRLAVSVIERVQKLNRDASLCCFGLYAPVNAALLRKLGVHSVIGGEFEQPLADLYRRVVDGRVGEFQTPLISFGKQQFRLPDRSSLPPLDRYAQLVWSDVHRGTVGYTEASRGCKHRCRHCPVVPVYDRRFRIVQRDVVLADVRQLVAQGADHVTFGDPDFFNGPGHAVALVKTLNKEFPSLTYDVTIKIEHLLTHAHHVRTLKETGCLFITTAVESVENDVLALLDKGHTRADFIEAASLCREVGLTLSPTFIPFTPWTTTRGYVDLLETLFALDLADSVAPIQLAIRLLVPRGSRLRELAEWHKHEETFDEAALSYRWTHADPEVERLFRTVRDIVAEGEASGQIRRYIFARIWEQAHASLGLETPSLAFSRMDAPPPYMSEAWYCCAEPTDDQIART